MVTHNKQEFKPNKKTARYDWQSFKANVVNNTLETIAGFVASGDNEAADYYSQLYLRQLERYHVNGVDGLLLPFVVTEEDERDYADTIAAFVEGTR